MGRKEPNPPPPDVSFRPDPPPPPPGIGRNPTGVSDTSWDVLKDIFTSQTMAGTLGRSIAINEAVRAFMSLEHYLKDRDDAKGALNADEEVKDVVGSMYKIQELIDAGIVSDKF